MNNLRPYRTIQDRSLARDAFRATNEIILNSNHRSAEQVAALVQARGILYDLAGLAFPESELRQE